MIKTKNYYTYMTNLKVKYGSKKYLFCFFFNIAMLNTIARDSLIKNLNVTNLKFLLIKNLVSISGSLIPSYGEYLIIYSNTLININNYEQFKLNCSCLSFKGNFINNLYFLNILNGELFFINNFMFFIGYLLYTIYIYLHFLSIIKLTLVVRIKKFNLNLC